MNVIQFKVTFISFVCTMQFILLMHALLVSYFIEFLSMVVIRDQAMKVATKLSNESFV